MNIFNSLEVYGLLTGMYAGGNLVFEDVPAFILGDSAYRNTENL